MAYRTPNKLIKTNYRVFTKLIELKANKFTLIIYYFGVECSLWTIRFFVCRETNLPLTTGDSPICECVVNWTKIETRKKRKTMIAHFEFAYAQQNQPVVLFTRSNV